MPDYDTSDVRYRRPKKEPGLITARGCHTLSRRGALRREISISLYKVPRIAEKCSGSGMTPLASNH